MKKLLYLTVILCITQICYSQTDFRQGFIISQKQDTTFGMIKYKEGNTTYRNCQFKSSDKGEIVTYKAEDISGYGFKNDKLFRSKKIETGEFVLLEVLVSGKVTLFKYENIFYLEKEGQDLMKLSNKSIQTIDGKEIEVESKTYLGLLSLVLSDSPALNQETIYRTTFKEKAITELIQSYNKSMNSTQVIYKYGKPWVHTRVGVSGGIISSQLSLIANNQALFHMGPFSRVQSPVIAAVIEIQSPRINEKFSIITNFMLNQSKYSSYNQNELGGKTTTNTVTIDMTHLKIPLGVRYTFRAKGVSAYLNAGLSECFNLSKKSDWIQTVRYITFFDTYEKEALEISKSQLGAWGGAGLTAPIGKVMRVFIEFRYEKQQGINASNYVELKRSDVTNFQFIIGLTSR